jgi:ABC-type multidrug transport system fused ATPase/permease subunit
VQANSDNSSSSDAASPGDSSRSIGALRLWTDGFRALGPDRLRLVLTGGLALVSGILETALLYLIARLALVLTSDPGKVVVGGIGPLPERQVTTGWIVVVACVLLVILVALAVPLMHSIASLSTRSLVRTRSRLVHAYLRSSWSYRSSEREGHFAQMVGEYAQRTEQLVTQLGIVIVAACQILMLMTGAVISSPLAACVAIVGLFVAAFSLRPLSRGVRSNSNKNATSNRGVVNDAQQVMRLGAEVTSFHVGDRVADTLDGRVRQAAGRLHRVRFISRLVPVLYQYAALGVVLAVVGVMTLLDTGALDNLAPVILLLIRALTYLRQLLTATQAGAELAPYYDEVEAEISALEANQPPPGTRDLAGFDHIDFEDVAFEYETGRPVLDAVQLRIARHEVLGLVGPSGGGKTTLTQLVLRLRQPTSGRIRVDGVDLSDVTPASWSHLSAYVPQENKLILATVADNIRFFRPGFTDEQIREAARRARLDDEVQRLPEGYDTLVGPGARSLSGGQCQRLGIARALLGEPQLLVLDEPTSALDPRSEELIRETLGEVARSATIVLVAHRPATLEICTRVLLVDRGSVRDRIVDVLPDVTDLDQLTSVEFERASHAAEAAVGERGGAADDAGR